MWGKLTWFVWSDFISKWSDVKCSDVGWTDVIYVKWFYLEVKWSEVGCGEVPVDKGAMCIRVTLYWGYLFILWLFYLGISCIVFVLICTVVVICCFVMCGNVCLCVCSFVMCVCFGNMYAITLGLPWLRFSMLFPQL